MDQRSSVSNSAGTRSRPKVVHVERLWRYQGEDPPSWLSHSDTHLQEPESESPGDEDPGEREECDPSGHGNKEENDSMASQSHEPTLDELRRHSTPTRAIWTVCRSYLGQAALIGGAV